MLRPVESTRPTVQTLNQVRRPVRSVQELGKALAAVPTPGERYAADVRRQAKREGIPLTPKDERVLARMVGDINRAKDGEAVSGPVTLADLRATDDGSPSMLVEAPEAFDDATGPIDPGIGIVPKAHGNPFPGIMQDTPEGRKVAAFLTRPNGGRLSTAAPAVTDPAGASSSTPAAATSACAAGGFRLSPAQRESLELMARHAVRTSNFVLLREWVETLVHTDRFDRAIAEGEKSIGKAFGHAAEMVRTQTRKARLAIGRQIIANPPSGKQFREDAIRNAEADEAAEREPRDYTEIDPPEVDADEDASEGGAR